jgi:hypothetical protein
MNAIQSTLGSVLLLLVSLVVILALVIVVLVEARFILRIGVQLRSRWLDAETGTHRHVLDKNGTSTDIKRPINDRTSD